MVKRKDPLIRFWAQVEKTETCWLWKGYCSKDGYGKFTYDPKPRTARAHRWIYEQKHGKIPKGLLVCHRCDVRNCVRDEHLFLGTHAENVRDCHAKNRDAYRKTDKSNYLNRVEKTGTAKLTWEIVAKIRAEHSSGESYRKLVKKYGVALSTIARVIRRERWVEP